jgi:hypothetical protein
MDRVLKLVYDYWIDSKPIANGVHPSLITHLEQDPSQLSNIINSDMVAFRDHNNFRLYIKKHVLNCVDIDKTGIVDDDAVYLYPVEIKTVLASLHQTHILSLDGQQYQYTFKDTLSSNVLKHINQGKVKILINYIHDPINALSDIKDIESYFNANGINPNSVIIVSGNSFTSYNGPITICRGHLFEQQAAEKMLAYPHMSVLGYVSDNVKPANLDPNVIRPKKFLSFNRQMRNRHHRIMIAYLALKHDLLKDGFFSFVGNVDPDEIDFVLQQFTLRNDLSSEVHKLIPLEIDTQNLRQDKKTSFSTNNNKKDLYLDSYVHITSETGFATTDVFFSEKTFRPIVNLQPFLSIGNVNCLKELRDLGFKTFHPYIDESYDVEPNPIKRMQLLETELKKLANMSINKLHQLYYSMTDILIHNQEHLKTFKDTNPYADIIKVI